MRAETEVEINRDLFISRSSVFKASQLAQLVKNLPANAGDARDVGLIPELGRSPREGNDNPLQYSSPWTMEPGGLQSMGLQRIRHDWSDWAHISVFNGLKIHQNKSSTVDPFYRLMECLWMLTHCLGFLLVPFYRCVNWNSRGEVTFL